MYRAAWIVTWVLIGCGGGSAEYTNVTPYGGTLELHGRDGSAMDHAKEMMVKQCGANNYVILQDWHDGAAHHVSFQCQNPGIAPQAPSSGGQPPPPPPPR